FAVAWLADENVAVNLRSMTPRYLRYYVDDYGRHTDVTPASHTVGTTHYMSSAVFARRFNGALPPGPVIRVTPAAPTVVHDPAPVPSSPFTANLNPGIAIDDAGDFVVGFGAAAYAPKTVQTSPAQTEHDYDGGGTHTDAAFSYNMAFKRFDVIAKRYD